MDFITAVKTVFRKYFVFSGRARRSEFWWWMLFTFLASIILSILDIVLFDITIQQYSPLNNLFSLLTLIPTISVTARRLHDINKSGWWQLLPFIPGILIGVGVVAMATSESMGAMAIIAIIGALALLVSVIVLIVWWATDGHKGDNRFGHSPKYGGQATAFD